MAAPEIREHTIDGTATVFFFARVYEDDRASAAAYDRARAKIGARDNTSVFRVRTPDGGRQLLFVLSGTHANAKRASERVAWGGEEYSPTTAFSIRRIVSSQSRDQNQLQNTRSVVSS